MRETQEESEGMIAATCVEHDLPGWSNVRTLMLLWRRVIIASSDFRTAAA